MPAAPLGERRGNSRARTVSGAARPRPRRPVTPIPSKLRAARAVGVGARAAAVAAALLATLILVVALATGGRGQRVVDAAVQTASGGLRLIGGARVLFDGGFAGLGFRVATVRVEGPRKPPKAKSGRRPRYGRTRRSCRLISTPSAHGSNGWAGSDGRA